MQVILWFGSWSGSSSVVASAGILRGTSLSKYCMLKCSSASDILLNFGLKYLKILDRQAVAREGWTAN